MNGRGAVRVERRGRMSKLVVTGATSMIGVALIEAALERGCDLIYAVVRRDCQKLFRLPADGRVKVIPCDLDQYEKLPELIGEPCDVFYHFAWNGTGAARDNSICGQAENILYSLNALHAAKGLGCRMFVGSGSQAEYGKTRLEKIDQASPIAPFSAYGVAKYAAGRLARMEADKLEIACVWARVFSVYGKYDKDTSMVASAIKKFLNHEVPDFTAGTHKWDYLYSADAGRAFYMIGENAPGSAVYCVGSGEARPLAEFITEMRDAVDPTLEIGLGRIPYPQDGPLEICADISTLRADTGWSPHVDFEQGIKEYVKFLTMGGGGTPCK